MTGRARIQPALAPEAAVLLLFAPLALAEPPTVPPDAPVPVDAGNALAEKAAALAALDAELAKAKAEVEALVAQANAPRRSAAELARLEVQRAQSDVDRASAVVVEKREAIRTTKMAGSSRDIREAKESLAAAKDELATKDAVLDEKRDAEKAAIEAGVPAPAPTPAEAAAEKHALELAQRRRSLLEARRALAAAELELARAPAAALDPAPLEAEVAARTADVERLAAELATAEQVGPR